MLVKFKYIEASDDYDYIKAVDYDDPTEIIKLVKQVDSIIINDEWYEFAWSEFKPAESKECLDILNIFVDKKYA